MPRPNNGNARRRQWRSRAGSGLPFCSAERSRGRQELSRRCLSPPGRVSTRSAGRGRSEGTGANRRCGRGRFCLLSLSPQERWSPAGARPDQSPPTEGNPRTNSRIKGPGPCLRRGDESCPECRAHEAEGTHQPGNGEAEPAVASPSAAPRRSPRPAGIVASMSEGPPGEFRRDRRTGWSEGTGKTGAAAGGVFYPPFLSPQERWSPCRARPANHRQPKHPKPSKARIKGPGPGLRRGDESCPDAAPETKAPQPPAMAKPSRQPAASLPFCSRRERSRGRRELSRRCLASPPGRVSTRPAGRGDES